MRAVQILQRAHLDVHTGSFADNRWPWQEKGSAAKRRTVFFTSANAVLRLAPATLKRTHRLCGDHADV